LRVFAAVATVAIVKKALRILSSIYLYRNGIRL
jgi:hypothetical protein